MEYKKYLSKGLESQLDSVPVGNCKLRFTTDTGRLFFDVEDKRLEISDCIKNYTESELENILSPLPKFYFTTDTNKLFIYLGNWVCIAGPNLATETYVSDFVTDYVSGALSEIVQFRSSVVEELPETGENGVIYFVPNTSSKRNNVYDEYVWVGSDFEMIGTTKVTLVNYTGATESTDGVAGLVPAPSAGDQDKYLKGDGTWGYGIEYSLATESNNGLMSSEDKIKLDGLVNSPEYSVATTSSNGLMSATDKTKLDGLTNYSVATTSSNGLMSATDKTKLDNMIATISITGTLLAGETSITLSNENISSSSRFVFYTSVYGVAPTSVTVDDGSVTLEFEAREEDMIVEAELR